MTSLGLQTARNAGLMVLAVAFFALNPPVSNLLLAELAPIALVTVAYTSAAVFTLIWVIAQGQTRQFLWQVVSVRDHRARRWLLAAGIMMSVNHYFLYTALASTTQHELTIIIIFETWPLIYYAQTVLLDREARGAFSLRDTLLALVAAGGFVTLAAQNIDIADWLLAEVEFLTSVGWAVLGALGMSITTHLTRSGIDAIAEHEGLGEAHVSAASTVAEVLRRLVSSLVLIVASIWSGQSFSAPPEVFAAAAGLGVVTLSLASILYYTSLARSRSPAIVMLWYTMPIMTILFFAVINSRGISEYEAIAATLIVSANILLNSKLDLSSSFKLLYFFMIVAGLVAVFVPPSGQTFYLEIVSAGLILYGLLAAGALARVGIAIRTRETALLELRHSLSTSTVSDGRAARQFLSALERILSGQRFSRPDDMPPDYALMLDRLRIALQRVVSPSELTVMTALCCLNVFLVLGLRQTGVVFDLFAFTSALATVYVILIIHEQDTSHAGGSWAAQRLRAEVTRLRATLEEAEEDAPKVSRPRDSFAISISIILAVYAGFFYAINARGVVGPAEGRITDRIVYQQDLTQDIVLGLPNWPSAQVRAHLLAVSFDALFEKNVVLYPASTDEILRGMGTRSPSVHIHPEVWTENVSQHIRRSVMALERVALSDPVSVGRQGLCTNPYGRALFSGTPQMVDLDQPQIIAGFDHDGDGLGEIWYGQINWESAKLGQLRALSYGYSDFYTPLLFGEQLLLEALERFDNEQRPFLFHCYSPHFMFERFNISFIAEPNAPAENWEVVKQASRGRNVDLLGPAPWPDTPIVMAYVTDERVLGPGVRAFLSRFAVPEADMNRMTEQVMREGMEPEEVAKNWFKANHDLVLSWAVP